MLFTKIHIVITNKKHKIMGTAAIIALVAAVIVVLIAYFWAMDFFFDVNPGGSIMILLGLGSIGLCLAGAVMGFIDGSPERIAAGIFYIFLALGWGYVMALIAG
jgi:hypothetical protein